MRLFDLLQRLELHRIKGDIEVIGFGDDGAHSIDDVEYDESDADEAPRLTLLLDGEPRNGPDAGHVGGDVFRSADDIGDIHRR